MKQVMTKFGSLKIDNGEDTMMSSDAIYYSDNFGRYLYRCSLLKSPFIPSKEKQYFVLKIITSCNLYYKVANLHCMIAKQKLQN